jgi:predicted short-subunit dehydrogenase-like oxidoreductase (DUF2520 family)
MQKLSGQRIVIVGCGNVAWHLAQKLHSLRNYEVHVYNHRPNSNLKELSRKFGAITHTSIENIIPSADFYFICVDDRFIDDVARKINPTNPRAVVLHTSGSVRIDALGNKIYTTAVFYPVQTFSINDTVKWREIPIIIETQKGASEVIMKFAARFSNKVLLLDYETRLKIHLSAVLVNNFPNALYNAASGILSGAYVTKKVNFDILMPLIRQTTEKVIKLGPHEAQTGPAKRGDKPVIKKHLKLLAGNSDLEKIYRQLSKLIVKQQERR